MALQDPQPGPAELVNLPSLEWLKADMSFFTFFPLHFGQVFSGAAVMDWNCSNWCPHLRHSYAYVGMLAYPSRISAGSCAFKAAFTLS